MTPEEITIPKLAGRLSIEERRDVITALKIAEKWGYGNLIAWIACGWSFKLRAGGLPEETAILHSSGRTPYPLKKLPKKP
jgi:hypothetical protein